jgi:hypothetical protein
MKSSYNPHYPRLWNMWLNGISYDNSLQFLPWSIDFPDRYIRNYNYFLNNINDIRNFTDIYKKRCGTFKF